MKYYEYPPRESWKNLFLRPETALSANEKAVSEILNEVMLRGDTALFGYARKFDGAELKSLRVTSDEITDAVRLVSEELKQAIRTAKANIEKFHRSQISNEPVVETMPGVRCWRKSVAIESVGMYIPGGSAPLFSTVLMLGVPAAIAGCKRVVLCTPPSKDGTINPAILFAASECGITEIFKVGGAQAMAAMRNGTETIPAVSKIFGPGNSWVTMAKQLIAKDGFPIDIPAGPSELAVLADETANPAFVAADLLSQAEHGPDSQVVLVSTDCDVIQSVIKEVESQVEKLSRKEIAERALESSCCILMKTFEEAMELINTYAPEHLILACNDAHSLASKVSNAGSVFIGQWSPESAGDYASGTNHTLPTNGNARGWSGVSLDSFVKKITFQELTRDGLQAIGKTVETMAEAEGLSAHRNAVTIRLNNKSEK